MTALQLTFRPSIGGGTNGVASMGHSTEFDAAHNTLQLSYDYSRINSLPDPLSRATDNAAVSRVLAHELGEQDIPRRVAASANRFKGHVLGLYHEHQRPDRDDHVIFNCQNLLDYGSVSGKLRDGDTMDKA